MTAMVITPAEISTDVTAGKEKAGGSSPPVGSNSTGPFPFISPALIGVRDGVRNCPFAEVLYPPTVVVGHRDWHHVRRSGGDQGFPQMARIFLALARPLWCAAGLSFRLLAISHPVSPSSRVPKRHGIAAQERLVSNHVDAIACEPIRLTSVVMRARPILSGHFGIATSVKDLRHVAAGTSSWGPSLKSGAY